MHRLSLDFLTAIESSPPELVEIAAANGLGLITAPIFPPHDFPDWDLIGDTPTRRETRRRCRDLGVEIDVFEAFYLRPETRVDSLRPAFESARWLEARRVVMVTQDDEAARLSDHAHQFCDLATEHGFEVLLEYSPRMTQKTLAEALAFVAGLDRPGVQVEADALHTFRSGVKLADFAAAPPGQVARAQLCDGPASVPPEGGLHEALKERGIPGEGALPLVDFLSVLPRDIVIGLEVPLTRLREAGMGPAERVARVAAATRRLLAEAGRDEGDGCVVRDAALADGASP